LLDSLLQETMSSHWDAAAEVGSKEHPRIRDQVINYGTAGFRTKADLLDHVMYRMGILAVLRSRAKAGLAIGAMITASHNPAPDNGIKLVDPKGEMLEQAWESEASALANCADSELAGEVERLVTKFSLPTQVAGLVVVGRDTRQSSPALSQAVIRGVEVVGGVVQDIGVVTTPQLHYMVVALNTKGGYGEPSLPGYYSKITGAFKKFLSLVGADTGSYTPKIMFDGANGVGATAMQEFTVNLSGVLDVSLVNTGEGELNSGCGADYVKVNQDAPSGMDLVTGTRCVSVDGDADRVLYYFQSPEGFRLLDGDRIATLVAAHLKQLLSEAGLTDSLELGLVQTAYANGSSTAFITGELGVPVACVPTGVKHLHHRAIDFDIGVYFEANGHGTVVFSDKAQTLIKEKGGEKLQTILDVINQTVGDAISDMLLVECVLADRGWDCGEWLACYSDLPNRLGKVAVRDRTLVTTTDAERKVVNPPGLQDRLEEIVAKFELGRSFVRPSGTEDCVRVYSEAATREQADMLNKEVSSLVVEMLG